MMATAIDSNSEVHFKEKLEEEGVQAEAASENATIRFDFRASTPATSLRTGSPCRGRRGTAGRAEKYDGKVYFEGWVNQFEEYATLGQWSEGEKASLLF